MALFGKNQGFSGGEIKVEAEPAETYETQGLEAERAQGNLL
jgi:hypothetical protein